MNDISAAERRLIAALDRLDHTVERAARRFAERPAPDAQQVAPAPAPAPPPDAEPTNLASPASDEMSAEIAALHARQAATLEAMQMRLAEANERLASAGEEAARLAAANDELARSNRALMDAAGTAAADSAAHAALEAEIESLRAARAAEIAQMSEILDALDRMLGVTTTPRSHSTGGRAAATRMPNKAAPELTVLRDEDAVIEDQPVDRGHTTISADVAADIETLSEYPDEESDWDAPLGSDDELPADTDADEERR